MNNVRLNNVFARYLQRRGWVVFYLDEDIRTCKDLCWLQLYEEHIAREGIKHGKTQELRSAVVHGFGSGTSRRSDLRIATADDTRRRDTAYVPDGSGGSTPDR